MQQVNFEEENLASWWTPIALLDTWVNCGLGSNKNQPRLTFPAIKSKTTIWRVKWLEMSHSQIFGMPLNPNLQPIYIFARVKWLHQNSGYPSCFFFLIFNFIGTFFFLALQKEGVLHLGYSISKTNHRLVGAYLDEHQSRGL